jgi:hypothetical protein
MNSFRLAQLRKWEILLILPVAGILLGYAFGGERGRGFLNMLFRPQQPGRQAPDDQESLILTTTDLRDLTREMRALQREISDLRARGETRARQDRASAPTQEHSTIILERFMTEPSPSEHPSLEDGSQSADIPSPPYALSEGIGRRYDR